MADPVPHTQPSPSEPSSLQFNCTQCGALKDLDGAHVDDDGVRTGLCLKCSVYGLHDCPQCGELEQKQNLEISRRHGVRFCHHCSGAAAAARKGNLDKPREWGLNLSNATEGRYVAQGRHAADLERRAEEGDDALRLTGAAAAVVAATLRRHQQATQAWLESGRSCGAWVAALRHAATKLQSHIPPEVWLKLRPACRGLAGCVALSLHEQAVATRRSWSVASASEPTRRRLAALVCREWLPEEDRSGTREEPSAVGALRRLELAVGSLIVHAQQVVVDSHKFCFFGGEQLLVLAWFSYFDGLLWRQCHVYEEWSDDASGTGETETLFVATGLVGYCKKDRFRFHWHWNWDPAHLVRAEAALRNDRGTAMPPVGDGGEQEADSSVRRLQAALGIRSAWAGEERFWGLFTTAWAGLPLTERAHEFGLCQGAYAADDSAVHLTCDCHGRFQDCPHNAVRGQLQDYQRQSLSWAMQRFLDPPPAAPLE